MSDPPTVVVGVPVPLTPRTNAANQVANATDAADADRQLQQRMQQHEDATYAAQMQENERRAAARANHAHNAFYYPRGFYHRRVPVYPAAYHYGPPRPYAPVRVVQSGDFTVYDQVGVPPMVVDHRSWSWEECEACNLSTQVVCCPTPQHKYGARVLFCRCLTVSRTSGAAIVAGRRRLVAAA